MIIDLNGELTEGAQARLDPFDRGFTLGDAIFESLRVRAAAPEFAAEHLARLAEASKVTGISLPFSAEDAVERMQRLIAANDIRDGALRLTVSRGMAARGVAAPDAKDCTPTVVISVHPLPPTRNDPVSAIIAQNTRRNDRSPLCRIKAAPYLDSILALDEARRRNAQDAILLNTRDRVVSAAYANLFCVIDGTVVTPPLADGPLPGITRQRLLAALSAEERSLAPDDLLGSEEIFLSNSFGVRAVIGLDDRKIHSGPVTAQALDIAG